MPQLPSSLAHVRAPALLACVLGLPALAAATDFTGTWTKDLRSAAEIRAGAECGIAVFELKQAKDQISGEHSMATPGCGRMNEGGEGSVRGVVVGGVAVLVVTSGRNGAMVLGKARRQGRLLHWESLEQIRPGEPEGDSPLILHSTTLRLQR